ncbi:g3908 [Coccomyxa viridis]|uniref:G3908 protein n=1 Tax=Coccomyxa viridis TaxID=1274662 RepID=A0ABP1FRV1_9CHLO
MAAASPPIEVPEHVEAQRKTQCPNNVLLAIYGKAEDKRKAYDHSLTRWWAEYSDRKNDEGDEHVSDSLLYDRNHLPRSAPPPECVHEARALQRQLDIPQGPKPTLQ